MARIRRYPVHAGMLWVHVLYLALARRSVARLSWFSRSSLITLIVILLFTTLELNTLHLIVGNNSLLIGSSLV